MAPRRRRSGSRAGAISAKLRAAIVDEAAAVADLQDPVEVVRAVGDVYAQLDHELETFARLRLDAIRQLRRAGWTYPRIVEETGLSKSRVAQLAREADAAGRARRVELQRGPQT